MPEPVITYNWKIERLDTVPQVGELTDVVRVIHWRLLASDGTNQDDCYGTVTLSGENPGVFVPYDELTQEQVIDWLTESIDNKSTLSEGEEPSVDAMKSSLSGVLAVKRNPPIATLPIPW